MLDKFRKINMPLIIGITILIFISIIAIFRIDIMNLDPFATNFALPHFEDGELVVDRPPNPPNDINIWGTDLLGRDVFSRVIYGARMTLQIGIYTALCRLIVGLIFGFFAGFGIKIISKIIDIFKTTFSSIPALIISFMLLGAIKPPLEDAVIIYTIVLTFVGWGRIGSTLRDRVSEILRKDFIKGELAIGKSKIQIAIQNVLPHLFATIVIYLFIEVSRVLIILGELGVLGLLVGTVTVDPFLIHELKLAIMPAYYPEWGSMLGTSTYAISAGIPWIVLYPALALFVSVLGFNLLGEGLKIELNKRNSKFITFIKHIPYHLSPITFIHQIKNMNRYKKSVGIKLSVIGLIILILLWPVKNSKYKIEADDVYSHIEELSQGEYIGRNIGNKGNENTRNYIVENLKGIGLSPLYEEKYTNAHEIEINLKTVKESNLYIEGKNISFDYINDFAFVNVYLNKIDEKNYDTEIKRKIMTMEMYENGEYNPKDSYVILIDEKFQKVENIEKEMNIVNEQFIRGTIREVNNISDLKGNISFIENQSDIDNLYSPLDLYVSNVTLKILSENPEEELVFSTTIENQRYAEIQNIGAVLKGKDDSKSPLIIATDYDYIPNEEEKDKDKGILYNGSSIAANLEIAKTLKNNDFKSDRDIIFLFFDGSMSPGEKGIDAFVKTDLYDELDKNHFLMYTKNLGGKDGYLIGFDTSRLYSDNRGHYGLIQNMMKRGEDLDLDTMLMGTNYEARGVRSLYNNGTSLTSITGKQYYGEKDINMIDKDILKTQTQIILDAITMYDYTLDKSGRKK